MKKIYFLLLPLLLFALGCSNTSDSDTIAKLVPDVLDDAYFAGDWKGKVVSFTDTSELVNEVNAKVEFTSPSSRNITLSSANLLVDATMNNVSVKIRCAKGTYEINGFTLKLTPTSAFQDTNCSQPLNSNPIINAGITAALPNFRKTFTYTLNKASKTLKLGLVAVQEAGELTKQ